MKTIIKISSLLMTLLALVGCKGTKTLLPNVSGKAGEVIVVMDRNNWENELGNSVRETLGADCPFLPQREPLYSIVNLTPSAFSDMFKIHRNILIFNIKNDVQKEKVIYTQNAWAFPQCVIQINAINKDNAFKLFEENKKLILGTLEQAERDRVIANCIQYEEKDLAVHVNEVFGGSPHFPVGYKLKKKTEDFIWIEDERQYSTQCILIYKYPVNQNEDIFSEEAIISHRNEIMKKNVPGMRDNSWMTTSTYVAPEVSFIKFKGRNFAETRGLWNVQNDYMGGPFVSHSFYSKDSKDIIVVEGFVYAPKFNKRQFLKQVESIIYSFEWENDGKKNEK